MATRLMVRLRQAVLVAPTLEPLVSELRATLGLGEPFRDPGVGEFGLVNAVFAIGDCFIEVIAPVREGTAAGRYIERHGGGGGYMAIFDIEGLEGARERAAALGVRVVWQIDLPDISGTHLHPADMRGAIVSLDRSSPYGSWRWGGPEWTGQVAAAGPGRLRGIEVAVADPAIVAVRWGEVLGVELEESRSDISLEGGRVAFRAASEEREEGIVEILLELEGDLPGGRERVELGGVSFRRVGPVGG